MPTETTHTCSNSCERPGCIRAQLDELVARLEALSAAQQQGLKVVEPVRNQALPGSREAEMVVLETDNEGNPTIWCDPEIADLVRALNVGGVRTVASCSGHGERLGSIALADGRALVICSSPDEAIAVIRSHEGQKPAAVDGCHCATCTCDPNMTPAVRFDLSPAQQEGAIREHLIRLVWTPPDEHAVSQPAAPSGAVNVVGMPEFDGLLDHIYEYGTAAEGVVERANAFARAVIARYAPQQPAAVDEAVVEAVARAICVACEENPDRQGDARGNEFRWQDYRDTAVAAISALATKHQEPSDG